MSEFSKAIASADAALDIEIKALQAFRGQIAGQLEPALKILANCNGHVVVTGLGKSGLIGAKLLQLLPALGHHHSFYILPMRCMATRVY